MRNKLVALLTVGLLLTGVGCDSPAPASPSPAPPTPAMLTATSSQATATALANQPTTTTARQPATVVSRPTVASFQCVVKPLQATVVPVAGSTATPVLVAPQEGLKLATLRFLRGSQGERSLTMTVELALSGQEQQIGLMGRTAMADDHGMLFDFGQPTSDTFWMENTALPLAIAFIDQNGTIIDIQEMAPFDDQTQHGPKSDYRYALEANTGYFARHCVQVADMIVVEP